MHRPAPRIGLFLLVLFVLLAPAALAVDEALDAGDADQVRKALAHKEPRMRLAAAQAAKALQDKKLTSPLVKLLKDDVREIRMAACDALALREDKKERKSAAKGMAYLLKGLPREPNVDQIEREALLVPALHDLAQPISIKVLLDIHSEAPIAMITERLMAVANVPSKDAIEALIGYQARRKGGHGHRGAGNKALRYATGQSFGRDPDKWRAWWRDAEKTFDYEAHAERRQDAKDKAEAREAKKEERKKKEGERRKKKPKKERKPDEGEA